LNLPPTENAKNFIGLWGYFFVGVHALSEAQNQRGDKKAKPDCLTFVRDNRDYNTKIQKIVLNQ